MHIQALAVVFVAVVLAGPLGAAAAGGPCAPCCEAMASEMPCHGAVPPECLREAADPCCRAQPAAPASPVPRAALDAPALVALPLAGAASPPPAPLRRNGADALARGPSPLRMSVVLQL